MSGRCLLRVLGVVFLVLATLLLQGQAAAQTCQTSLLHRLIPSHTEGIDHPELLTDGWLSPPGFPFDVSESAQMRGEHSYAQWDLGKRQQFAAATVEADANDSYELRISDDGQRWETLWEAGPVSGSGLMERTTRELKASGRYLRLEAKGGDGKYAVAEVRVFSCIPDPWPPRALVRFSLVENPKRTRVLQRESGKVALGLLGAFLLFVVVPAARRKWVKPAVAWGLIGISAAVWIEWGTFRQFPETSSSVLVSDIFHYYMGAKYFREIGYFELYRCTIKAEKELGRQAEFDAAWVRDTDTNRAYPGWWSQTYEGRCRAEFTPERWAHFREDVDRFHRMTANQVPMTQVVADHGFNGTPFHVACLKPWANSLEVTYNNLLILTLIDFVALIAALAIMRWGFGDLVAAGFALILAIGHHWNYNWMGGEFARHVWLAWGAAGIVLLHKKKPFWGAVALTLAGLHRFFPFVFVGALGLYELVQWAKDRRLSSSGKQIFAGIGVTLALGCVLAGSVNGWQSLPDHARVIIRHANSPSGNHVGLPVVLGWAPGRNTTSELKGTGPQQSDPHEIYGNLRVQRRKERLPLQLLAMLASVGLVAWTAYRGRKDWESTLCGGALIYSMQAMTSYDYMWLLLLVPLAWQRRRRYLALLGYAVFTALAAVVQDDFEVEHIWAAFALMVLFVYFYWDVVRETLEKTNGSSPDTAQT